MPQSVPVRLMETAIYRNRFKTWLLQRLGTLRPRHNTLQFKETLELKARGLSSRGVAVLSSKTRYIYLFEYCKPLRSVLPRSTFYKRIVSQVTASRHALQQRLISPGTIAIHWLDNFARNFARQGLSLSSNLHSLGIYLDRETFVSMLWTAHGVKLWPSPAPVSMAYVLEGGNVVRAMPRLSFLMSDELLHKLGEELQAITISLYENSLSEQRRVRRIPLKPRAITDAEEKHLRQSLDGLSSFEPVDIYNVNIQAYSGLLRSIQHCQLMEGFGVQGGPKTNSYSSMLLDVSTFWMTFRLLYSFTGLAPILCDLFVILGPWHTYMYSHVCVWSEFRSMFLASAFFSLFPSQNLFFRPRLVMSSTFFTWLRAAYPSFRPLLLLSLNTIKNLRIVYDIQYTNELKNKKLIPKNPYENVYLNLYNLFYLFEFVLPAIADYGSALKLNNWEAFRNAYLRLFRFFLTSKSQGKFIYSTIICRCADLYPCHVRFLWFARVLASEKTSNIRVILKVTNIFLRGVGGAWFVATHKVPACEYAL